MKKDVLQAKIDAIMVDCYNLLLNPDIKDEERELLLHFKQEIENKRDFSRTAYRLNRDLQRLSLKYLQDKKGLSQPVRAFYDSLNHFMKTELRNNEIAKGLIMASGIWL